MTDVYRFEGWSGVADLFSGMNRKELPDVRSWLSARADRVLSGWREGRSAASVILSSWHPALVGRGEAALLHPPTEPDAQLAVAREHGFEHWDAVATLGVRPFDPDFEGAVDLMLEGDAQELRTLLQRAPSIVQGRSPFAHSATLLHYIAANGVETERQVTPLNAPEVVALVLAAGAAPDATMPVYGGEHTTLELLVTSAHPAAAGVAGRVAALLRS